MSLDGHDARRKVGIITSAEIVDGRLQVGGYLFARDFPELIRELHNNGRGLGMSYEIADAHVADVRASIWVLTDVTFTGAAILRREKAAYPDTWIALEASTEYRVPSTEYRVPSTERTPRSQKPKS